MFQKIKVNSNLVGEIKKKCYTYQIIPYDIIMGYPLVNKHKLWKITIFNGKIHYQ